MPWDVYPGVGQPMHGVAGGLCGFVVLCRVMEWRVIWCYLVIFGVIWCYLVLLSGGVVPHAVTPHHTWS